LQCTCNALCGDSSLGSPPQNLYKADLSFMKGVAWDGVGAPQLESAKKAGEMLSNVSAGELGLAGAPHPLGSSDVRVGGRRGLLTDKLSILIHLNSKE